jgi:hypothetical protein
MMRTPTATTTLSPKTTTTKTTTTTTVMSSKNSMMQTPKATRKRWSSTKASSSKFVSDFDPRCLPRLSPSFNYPILPSYGLYRVNRGENDDGGGDAVFRGAGCDNNVADNAVVARNDNDDGDGDGGGVVVSNGLGVGFGTAVDPALLRDRRSLTTNAFTVCSQSDDR